jgi:hypothetical protein
MIFSTKNRLSVNTRTLKRAASGSNFLLGNRHWQQNFMEASRQTTNMNWNTVYLTGRADFREDVRRKLDHSHLNYMPGYIDNSMSRVMHDLFWLDESINLRTFKEAIGSKLILKYRLRFFTNLEEFVQSQNQTHDEPLTKEELEMIAAMLA